MKELSRFFSLIVLAAACSGGSKTATTTPPASSTAQAVSTAAPSKASIAAFHDVLAPLWHAAEGPERTDKTCAATATMEQRAQDIGDAPLVEAVHALAAECAGNRQAFQAKFTAVHTAFHAVAEKAGPTEEKKQEAQQ